MATQLFTGQAADGTSAEFTVGSQYAFADIFLSDTFGGGTATIEIKAPDGTTFIPLQTVTGPERVRITETPFIGRLSLAGSTTPSLNAWVELNTEADQRIK